MRDEFGDYGIDTITNFKNPKRIRLTVACVYLESYFANSDRGMVAKAIQVLDEHKIELDVFPGFGTKTAWNTLPNTTEPIADTNDAYKAIYKAAKAKIRQMGCGFVIPLPVIFGEFVHRGYGIAPKVPGELTRLCMISATGNSDQMDFLHEIGHAAGLGHEKNDSHPRNFMHQASPRTTIYKYQIEAFAKAPFSVG
ncbi:MAG: hypothetical protein K1X72_22705 [Pyrinomonadaceae bacterium]|nr:hypothetical protein [Pyrinomonadaceae bacterium]